MRVLGLLVPMLLAGSVTATPIPVPPPVAKDAKPTLMLESLLTSSRTTARVEQGRLAGPGAELLRQLSRESRFVLVGEAHGNQGIADFATAWWRDLADLGFTHAGLEADPWTVAELEKRLRAGGIDAWSRHLADNGGAMRAPFYSWAPEAEWAAAIVATSPAPGPVLLGIDQVFLGAAHPLLSRIAGEARAPAAREKAGELARLAKDPFWLGRADPIALKALRAELDSKTEPGLVRIVDALVESQSIYAPFSGGPGETWEANNAREQLMRRAFLAHLRRAESETGRRPRAMLKLGASHAHRGASTTLVQGFGGFVTELAAMDGDKTLSVLMLCGPGAHAAAMVGPETDCMTDPYSKGWDFVEPHLVAGQATIFDLRSWRLRPRRWAHLPPDVQRAIGNFDLLVIPAATPGSKLLPGLKQPQPPVS
jgi:hypothetical protein